MMNSKRNLLALIILASLLFSGCFIFRPKNRCDSCPDFNNVHTKPYKGNN
ncbi:MAG: hypothetical protein ACLQQ4_11455 [Bacteroidia bacterium]